MYWILYNGGLWYAVLGSDCTVTEFSKDELRVLARFLHIIGYAKDPCVAVLSLRDRIVTDWLSYSYTDMPTIDELEEYKKEGYLFCNEHTFPYYSPALLMRYGFKAIVTDTGRLLYLKANGERIVLGEFCASLEKSCVRGKATLVFDDRVRRVSGRLCRAGEQNIRCDMSAVTDMVLAMSLASCGLPLVGSNV